MIAPLDIACSCDDRFAQHAGVAIASALAASATPHRMRFWIITSGLAESNVDRLRQITDRHGATLEILPVDLKRLHGAPVGGHITLATYFRIFLPELLPESVTKLVYLDADVVVRRDLGELLAQDLGDNLVGAVVNPRFQRWSSLGLDPSMGYFNAGILLIPLDVWRRESIQEKLCEIIATRAPILKQHDQDALNIAVAGRWQRLDLRWNQQYSFFLVGARGLGLSPQAYQQLTADPFIVHYSGSTKPWAFSDDHPLRPLYFRYLNQTPFAPWRPQPRDSKDWIRKLVRLGVPHRLRPRVFGW